MASAGDGRRERRIDAARKPQQHLGKARLARVIAHAQHQRVPDFRLDREIVVGDGARVRAARSTTSTSSRKPLARANSRPCASKAQLRPSKIRSSLPPTWLTIDQRQPVLPRHVAQHVLAQKLLARRRTARPRGSGWLPRRTCHQRLDGVVLVAAALPEIAVVPDVFADADAQAPAVPNPESAGRRPARSSGLRQTHRRWAAGSCEMPAQPSPGAAGPRC